MTLEFLCFKIDENKLKRNYLLAPLKRGEKLSYDELHYLYLELNMSQKEISAFTGRVKICRQIKELGLIKSDKQTAECAKRTFLQKYGVENPSFSKEILDKIKRTNLERHGVEYVMQAKTVKEKAKNTYMKHFGHEHSLQASKIKDKITETCLKKYGCKNPMQNEEVKEKAKQTNIEKYGCKSSMQNKDVLAKTKQTNLERYGVEWGFGSKEIQKKIKQTNLERYGVENASQREEIRDKVRQTNLEKYGVEYGAQSKEIQEKIKQTNLERYGRISTSQIHLKDETFIALRSKAEMQSYITKQEIKTVFQLAINLGVAESTIYQYLHKYDLYDLIEHYTSSYEVELQELFPNTFIKTRKPIFPYEIDLYSEEHKFGIEFNGNYWHCEEMIEDFRYHQKKSLLAQEKGIFLYHIWEYEWLDERKREIILSQIRNLLNLNETKIFARKCKIENIPFKAAKDFLNENHIQSSCSSRINLGLYFEDELVSIMTFGKPRFNKKCEYELIRFCNKKNCSVIGSASKLFKHFIKDYKPTSIISYSHIDKGRGKLYENLGFKLESITDPDYVWWKGSEVLSRYQCQKHKLLRSGFEGSTEREIMENQKYRRLFSCGNKVWIYRA